MRDLHARNGDMVRSAVAAGIRVHAGTDAGGFVEHGRVADEVTALGELIGARQAMFAASHSAREWLGLPDLRHRCRRRPGDLRRGSGRRPRRAAPSRRWSSGRAGSRVGSGRLIIGVTEWSGYGCRPAPLSGRGRHWCVRIRCPTRSQRRPPIQTCKEYSTTVAVKIKLARFGKIREPFYRIVVADARTRRSGRAIENIGLYHPKADPSVIQVDSDRAQYWLGVGAQPTESVQAMLKVTGDWQKFKGLPGAEGTLRVAGRRPTSARCTRPRWPPSAATTATPRPPRRRSGPHGRDRRRRGAPRARERRRVVSVLEDALEHLVRGIVDNEDEVSVELTTGRRGRTLQIRVHPDDLGKVIGRGGRTATALRTVMSAVGGRGIRVDVVDTDR